MNQGGIFKKVAANSLGNRTRAYEVTYTVEGQMAPNFNPLTLLQGPNGSYGGVDITGTTTTTYTNGGKTIVMKGNGNAPMDINKMMAMFKNQMDGDIEIRMDELNDICQNSTKTTTRKGGEVTVTTINTKKLNNQSNQSRSKNNSEAMTIVIERPPPVVIIQERNGTSEVVDTEGIAEVPRIRAPVKRVIQEKKSENEPTTMTKQPPKQEYIPPPPKQENTPPNQPVLPPKPAEDKFKTLPNELPSIKKLEFNPKSQKLITGKYSKEKTSKDAATSAIDPQDCVDTFGLAALWYQNSAYTDGRYNMNDWKVQAGNLGTSLAYRVYPPASKFQNFLGSHHAVCFMLPEKAAYKLFSFQNNCLTLVAEKPEGQVKAGQFNVFSEAMVSELGAPIIYLVEKSTTRISPYTILKNNIQGATIYKDKQISIEVIKLPLPEEPKTPDNFNHGPNTHGNQYSPNRDNYRFTIPNKEVVVWSGPSDNIFMTHIDRLNLDQQSVKLETKKNHIIGAATGNGEYVYYIIVQKGEGADKTKGIPMYLIKANVMTGKVVKEMKLPTDKDNLNVWQFDTCMLVLNSTFIGMIVTRRMTKHTDGLNHQGGLAALFNTETLQMVKNHGQTSGHSFGSSLMLRSDGFFMGMDLGDNYPRGVHCWNFDDKRIEDRTVYSFKTQHGKEPQSPAGVKYPPYDEISKNGEKFYKWSNDNRTYTQLAAPGLIEQEDGVMVFFCGQNLPHPFDNGRTKDYCNCARNVGFVKVSKKLVADDSCILSQGPAEKGGFFCFNGKWNVLSNKGIQWLTKFNGEQNVSRLKATRLQDKIFVIFEIWDKMAYLNTQYMIVQKSGSTSGPVKLDVKIRLHKADDIFYDERSSSVMIYAGEKGKVLNRYEVRLAK